MGVCCVLYVVLEPDFFFLTTIIFRGHLATSIAIGLQQFVCHNLGHVPLGVMSELTSAQLMNLGGTWCLLVYTRK